MSPLNWLGYYLPLQASEHEVSIRLADRSPPLDVALDVFVAITQNIGCGTHRSDHTSPINFVNYYSPLWASGREANSRLAIICNVDRAVGADFNESH